MDPKADEYLVCVHSNLRLLSWKDERYNCIKNERQGCGTLVEHDLLDDGVRLHELENMALDESNLEAMLFVDDGNGREENDTISGRQ